MNHYDIAWASEAYRSELREVLAQLEESVPLPTIYIE